MFLLAPVIGSALTVFGNDSNTCLLMHGDGTNGAGPASFVDSALGTGAPHSFSTGAGSPQIDTLEHKFGVSSILLNGASSFRITTTPSEMAFGTGDFTVDFWTRVSAVTGTRFFIDFRGGPGSLWLAVRITSGVVQIVSNNNLRISGSTTLSIGIWYHIAYVRSGGVGRLYVNGVQEGSDYTDSVNYGLSGSRPIFGVNGSTGTDSWLNGYIDEVRVSLVARWTSGFTPPALPYGP